MFQFGEEIILHMSFNYKLTTTSMLAKRLIIENEGIKKNVVLFYSTLISWE